MTRPDAANRVRLRLLGRPEMRVGDKLVSINARKDIALLGVLALSSGWRASRSRLAGLLWSESEEARARGSLKQAIRRLRQALSDVGAIDAIEIDRQSIALADHVEVDAVALRKDGGGTPQELAAGLVHGPLLDDIGIEETVFRNWLQAQRTRIEADFLALAVGRMRRAESAGHHEIAAELGRGLLAWDPLNEEAVRVVMRRHISRGERGRALDAFGALRDRLSEELSLEPEPETQALLQEARRPPARDVSRRGPERKMAVLGDGPSLLVMPFNNIGHDPTQDYFAAGLAEDLAVDLARIPGLTIASPDAVDRRRALGPAADAARELGARVVLSGSVRLEGRRLRVTVRLIDAGNSGILWTDRYERSQTDVLSLQSEISGAVAQALKVKLLETELVHGLSAGTTDEGAQLFYLKARSFHLRGADARSLEIARVLYLRAIERDPNFARALAQLAICESHLAMGKNTFDDADAELCMSHAQQALHLDPHLAEAHAGRGLAHYGAGDYDAASEALDVAVSLNPMLYEACFFQGRNRRLQGRRREAADFFERAAALRTGDYRSMGLLGEELQALGRHQDAGGAFADCLGRLEAEVDSHPQNADALAFGAAVLVDLGRPEQAAEWASWALLLGEGQRLVHYNVARTWALLQRRDAALDELERAFKAAPVVQRRLALWMANDEDLRSLANEARYRQLLDSRTATL